MCLLLNIPYNANGFLQIETLLNMKLQMNYLQKDNWALLLKCWHTINLAYVLHMRQIACLNRYWHMWVHASAITCHSLTGLMRWKAWFVSLKLCDFPFSIMFCFCESLFFCSAKSGFVQSEKVRECKRMSGKFFWGAGGGVQEIC